MIRVFLCLIMIAFNVALMLRSIRRSRNTEEELPFLEEIAAGIYTAATFYWVIALWHAVQAAEIWV